MINNQFKKNRISTIILNWNGWEDTIECLESLYQVNYKNCDIIIVDNGSNDNSVDMIEKYCQGKLEISSKFIKQKPNNKPILISKFTQKNNIRSKILINKLDNLQPEVNLNLILLKKNLGFSGGNNIGIVFALKAFNPDFIFLLNNDTVIENNCLTELVEFFESDENIGIIGPRIHSYYIPERNQNEKVFGSIEKPTEFNCVPGCAYLIKTNVIKSIGLFDPIYMSYKEEDDYCFRARKEGYKIYYIPTKDIVFHKKAASSKKIPGFIMFYMTRNVFIFWKKIVSKRKFIELVIQFLKTNIRSHLRTPSRDFYYFIKGVIAGLIISFLRKQI